MTYIDDHSIEFNNVKTSGVYLGTNGPLTTKSKYKFNSYGNIVHRDGDFLVNAIDIHWGGAQYQSSYTGEIRTINTTGDLIDIINNIVGAPGQRGPEGPMGLTGKQGNQGVQGKQGNSGQQGIKGDIGPQGNIGNGNQGKQGNKGEIGYQGNQGIMGKQGPQGISGMKGNQGAQGAQGQRGEIGYQGMAGTNGNQGKQGNKGEVGYQGNQGNIGKQGNQGIMGTQGLPGVQGNEGQRGSLGPQGAKGNQGNIGAQGEEGLTGPQGQQGAKGDTGNSGYSGNIEDLEIVNNVNQGGETAALSAEMGKQLYKIINELKSEVDNLKNTLSASGTISVDYHSLYIGTIEPTAQNYTSLLTPQDYSSTFYQTANDENVYILIDNNEYTRIEVKKLWNLNALIETTFDHYDLYKFEDIEGILEIKIIK